MVNLVGVVSLFTGESLKYTISGQSRNYLLTVFVGVIITLVALVWSFHFPYSIAQSLFGNIWKLGQ
jgi:NAD(P)H-quinone oxidoreductase subunit 5